MHHIILSTFYPLLLLHSLLLSRLLALLRIYIFSSLTLQSWDGKIQPIPKKPVQAGHTFFYLLIAKIVLAWNVIEDYCQDLCRKCLMKFKVKMRKWFFTGLRVCLSQWIQAWPQRIRMMKEAATATLQWRIFQLPSRLSSELSGEVLPTVTPHISLLLADDLIQNNFQEMLEDLWLMSKRHLLLHLQTCMHIRLSSEKLNWMNEFIKAVRWLRPGKTTYFCHLVKCYMLNM